MGLGYQANVAESFSCKSNHYWVNYACGTQVHRTFNSRHGRRGRHQVLNVFKTAAEGSPRRLVAQRSLNWGRGDAVASPWLQNGCTSVSQSSPRNICVLYLSSVPQCGRRFCLPSTSAVPPIACFEWWLWRPLCLHSAIMATLEHSCRRFCILSASLCDLLCLHIQSLNRGVFQGRHKGRRGSYTETSLSGFGRPFLVILWVAQKWREGRSPVQLIPSVISSMESTYQRGLTFEIL